MTTFNTHHSWQVGKVAPQCAGCGAVLAPQAVCWAALCDRPLVAVGEQGENAVSAEKDGKTPPSPFVRIDFCEKCWQEGKRPQGEAGVGEVFSHWKTVVPVPEQKKKLLVDDSVLMDVFGRMEGKNEPQEVRFRFVLALILMRKRLLKYEGMEGTEKPEDGGQKPEVWRMIPRGTETVVHVVNPHLTAEQITEVSQQLSAILAEEV